MRDFKNKIICGDCIELLGRAKEPFADLVFADPPFNIGYQYDKYRDKVEKNNYIAWTKDWMAACVRVLKPNGSFYIAIGDDYAAHVRIIGDELGLTLRNWIIWHYTFGQQTKQKFARSHTHILYFVKDAKNFVFNDGAVRLPSDRQTLYNDKRADARGKLPDDTWNQYSRVCGTFKERQGWHPCQMPELLLARIVAASSNADDLVLDPFIGSGTTAAAASQLNRLYCGIDVSQSYVENAQARLAELEKVKHSRAANGLDMYQSIELKRLFVETGINAQELLDSEKLFNLFCGQLSLRLNGQKIPDRNLIRNALEELLTWLAKK